MIKKILKRTIITIISIILIFCLYITYLIFTKPRIKKISKNNPHYNVGFLNEKNIKKKKKEDVNYISWKLFNQYNPKTKKMDKELSNMINKEVSINGYMIPMDNTKSKKIKSLILAPYVPTCYHTPPPPMHMLILVELKTEIKYTGRPITIKGKLIKPENRKESVFKIINAKYQEYNYK